LYFVLSGAEEIGQIGAADFLNSYRNELDKKNTFLLNFEMIGLKKKPLEIIDSYSFPKKQQISPSLLEIAKESAEELQYKLKKWYLPIGANTDGILFYKEGFDSLNFVSKEAGKYTHLPKDQYSLIDPSIIEKQVDLNISIIKKLDNPS
jgi:Zn-dependent M28 family amino/carboxypeptidase